MNKVLLAILLFLMVSMLSVTACGPNSEPPAGAKPTSPAERAEAGYTAPDFQLQSLDGKAVSLGSLRGKPVLINFWATWCGPCRGEMPYLQQIYRDWSGRGLEMLAIDVGENASTVQDYLRTNNLSLPVLLDINETVLNRYHIVGIPTTFFVDKDGIIQEKVVGAFPNKESIEEHLGKLVN